MIQKNAKGFVTIVEQACRVFRDLGTVIKNFIRKQLLNKTVQVLWKIMDGVRLV